MTAYNALTRNMNVDELLNAAERETITPGSAVAELVRYVREVQSDLEALEKIEDHLDGPIRQLAANFEAVMAQATYTETLARELFGDGGEYERLPSADDAAEYLRNREDTQKMADYTAELMDELDCRDVDNLPSPAGIVAALDDAEQQE